MTKSCGAKSDKKGCQKGSKCEVETKQTASKSIQKATKNSSK